MKNFLLALLLLAVGLGHGKKPPEAALEAIRAEDVRRHILFLASDSLKGRDTPSPGLVVAGDYIASEFKRYGLQPVNGSFFQNFDLALVNLGEDNALALISRDGTRTDFTIKHDYIPFEFTANREASGELVFAGYGITAPEYHYDDYTHLDARGKVVFVLRHEPQERDSTSLFDGQRNTDYAEVREKVRNAIEHGAVAVLVATDPLNHRSLVPRGFPWPSLYEGLPEEAVPYSLALTESKKVPVVHVGENIINKIFGTVDSLRSLQQAIDKTLRPHSFAVDGVTLRVKTSTRAILRPTRNVVAFLEGDDPKLKDEVVLIGAHYDHVGVLKTHEAGADSVFNGADDNASGTCGLLEIAKAFGASRERPRRSVLFVAFAAEEKGLLGSEAYVNQPLFPLSKTAAMINLDMLGRNAPDSVTVIGYKRSPDLHRITVEENGKIGMTLAYNGERWFYQSDHASFARKGIPVLFFNTGDHPDLHKVTDNPDKINYAKVARIAKLVFRVAWRAATTDKRFAYLEPR